MIKFENINVWGFEHAIRGMRNSKNSWDRIDSFVCNGSTVNDNHCNNCINYKVTKSGDKVCCNSWNNSTEYIIGKNDLLLMQKLIKAGTSHRKFLRQVFISIDITAPLYWWKEFDTYKVGTVSNSCSSMYKIHTQDFTVGDFSHEHLTEQSFKILIQLIDLLNNYRKEYVKNKDKNIWWQLIQLLPTSYNQKRTITLNYENVLSIIQQRENHRLDEWIDLVNEFKELPYMKQLTEQILK